MLPSRIFITCYRDMARDSNNQLVGAPLMPPLCEQTVDITYESIAGFPFPPYTRFICIKPEIDCCIAIGFNPVADPKYHWVEAGERIYYGVMEGQQLAVIDSMIKDEIHGIHDAEQG